MELYQKKRPEVIQALKNSGMTISYHVRPPHPLYSGFDQKLTNLDPQKLKETLKDYETYALDLTTGQLNRNQSGGYLLVKEVFGKSPVAVAAPNSNHQIKSAALQLYQSLWAQMMVAYHETGTKMDQPFEWREGFSGAIYHFAHPRK